MQIIITKKVRFKFFHKIESVYLILIFMYKYKGERFVSFRLRFVYINMFTLP